MTTETIDRPAPESAPEGPGAAAGRVPAAEPTPPADLPPLRIAHLWPRLLNVAGDGGNVTSVELRSRWRGIRTETVAIEAGDPVPDFTSFDIVFAQGGQDVEMALGM